MAPLKDRVRLLETQQPRHDVSSAIETDDPKTEVAKSTKGPQRFTFFVKKDDDTVLNLGQESQKHKVDRGISGETLSHLHLETFADGTVKTAVSLGAPPIHCRLSRAPGVPDSVHGYSMATAGNAFQHAGLQHYITSATGDVILRSAERMAVLQADTGHAEVTAGKDVTITAGKSVVITAAPFSPDAPADQYDKVRSPTAVDGGNIKTAAYATKVLNFAQQVVGLYTAGRCLVGNDMAPGSTQTAPATAAKATAIAKMVAGVAGTVISETAPSIKATGAQAAKVGGGVCTMISGTLSASLVGCIAAGIKGVVADAKGFAYASLWGGVSASLRGGRNAYVTSTKGKLTISAKNKASVVGVRRVTMVGQGNVQMAGKEASVSGDQAYVGAGGFGLLGKGDIMQVGAMKTGSDFAAPGPKEPFVEVSKNNVVRFQAKQAACALWIQSAGFDLYHDSSICTFGVGEGKFDLGFADVEFE